MWMIPSTLIERSVITGDGTLAWRPGDFLAILAHFRTDALAPVLLGGQIYTVALSDTRFRWRLLISGREDEQGLREKSYAMAEAYIRRYRRRHGDGYLCAPAMMDLRAMFSEDMLRAEVECKRAVRAGCLRGRIIQTLSAVSVRNVGTAETLP